MCRRDFVQKNVLFALYRATRLVNVTGDGRLYYNMFSYYFVDDFIFFTILQNGNIFHIKCEHQLYKSVDRGQKISDCHVNSTPKEDDDDDDSRVSQDDRIERGMKLLASHELPFFGLIQSLTTTADAKIAGSEGTQTQQ